MEVTVCGPVWEPVGYAEMTRCIVRTLTRLGLRVGLRPFSLPFFQPGLDPGIRSLLEAAAGVSLKTGPVLYTFLPETFEKWPDRPTIGYSMFEADRIPAHWVEKCNLVDEVWVPSRFNRETFAASGVLPQKIRVVPLGVDTDRFHPGVTPMSIPRRRGFIFLANFQWGPRKGQETLLRAYIEEFSGGEDVCLIVKTYQTWPSYDPRAPFLRQEMKAIIDATHKRDLPAIFLITEIIPAFQMPRLYTAADCFLSMSHGEGWDLPALEAMASGLPVIATAWSAHLDYLNENNGYPLTVEGLEPSRHPHPLYHGSYWARPSLVEARRLLRHVFSHRQEARAKGTRARNDILSGYSWDISGRRMAECLASVQKES